MYLLLWKKIHKEPAASKMLRIPRIRCTWKRGLPHEDVVENPHGWLQYRLDTVSSANSGCEVRSGNRPYWPPQRNSSSLEKSHRKSPAQRSLNHPFLDLFLFFDSQHFQLLPFFIQPLALGFNPSPVLIKDPWGIIVIDPVHRRL